MDRRRGKLFDRANMVDGGLRQFYHEAKDKHVTPPNSLSTRTKDNVGPHTGVPTEVLSEASTYKPKYVVKGTPIQKDGTLLTRESTNVRPGPNSSPWFRVNSRDVPAGRFDAVLRITIPEGYVYHLSKLGHTFLDPNDEFWIMYDGRMYNNSKWSIPLGAPNSANLYKLPVTITATKQIQCFVRNNGAVDRAYEFMVDGWYDPIEHLHGSRTV